MAARTFGGKGRTSRAPVLDLDFTRNDTVVHDVIAVSGGANGTRVNSAGAVEAKTAPRVAFRPELVSNGTFDANTDGWTAGGGAAISVDAGRLKLTNTAAVNGACVASISTVAGRTYQLQFTITAGTGGGSRILVGTAQFTGDLLVTAFTTGEQSAEFTATSTTTYISPQQASTAIGQYDFFDNISVREIVDGSACEGLLIEEARTNLFWPSEDFSTGWDVSFLTVTPNAAVAPSGTNTADLLEYTATPNANILRSGLVPIANGQIFTYSVYVRSDVETTISIQFLSEPSFSQWNSGDFTRDVTTGWTRIQATATVSGITTDTTLRVYMVTRDGVARNIYAWGAQLEAGSFATSYIPTTTAAAVTRTADSAVIDGARFASFFSASGGTLVVEFVPKNPNGSKWMRYVQLQDDGTQDNTVEFYVDSSGSLPFSARVAAASSIEQYVGSVNWDAVSKIAISMTTTGVIVSLNGGAAQVLNGTVALAALARLTLGSDGGATHTFCNSPIRRVTYYDRPSSARQVQMLATV